MFYRFTCFLYARLQTGLIMVWWCRSVRVSVRPCVRLSVRPSGAPSARFPHFSHTCFDILSLNFAHDFVLMFFRSSLSVVTLWQFLKELCLFVKLLSTNRHDCNTLQCDFVILLRNLHVWLYRVIYCPQTYMTVTLHNVILSYYSETYMYDFTAWFIVHKPTCITLHRDFIILLTNLYV